MLRTASIVRRVVSVLLKSVDSVSALRRFVAFSPLMLLAVLAQGGALQAQTAASGGSWTQQAPATSPSGRSGAATAYDAGHSVVVMFGGFHFDGVQGTYLAETWTWNGTTWTNVTPAGATHSPSPRTNAAMAYDSVHSKVVLFGGFDGTNPLSDTWTWDGTTWTEVSPTSFPGARQEAAMAWDPAAQKIVLFGGESSGATNDTWTWDGTNWTQQIANNVAGSPPARYAASIASDTARTNVVLFGGAGSGSALGDTWTWNGLTNTWTQASPSASPSARSAALLAYDATTGTSVLFGGGSTTGALNDTWVWDGTNWYQQSAATIPPARNQAASAYEAATGGVVLFGGSTSSGSSLADTWNYAPGGAVFVVPTTAVGTAAAQTPVTFTITGTGVFGALSNSNVLTLGVSGVDFTLGTGSTCTVAGVANTTCEVNVAFTPTAPGLREGAVNLKNATGTILATAYVYGNGTGPQAVFNPGTASTVGGGFNGPNGLAVDAAGTVYVADANNKAIKQVPAGCASSTCTTSAESFASQILNVALDGAGNIYGVNPIAVFVDSVDTVDAQTTAYHFGSVAVDGSRNLYIADSNVNAVFKVSPGCSSTLCATQLGGGFSVPNALALDSSGNLYVADTGNKAIKQIPAGCTSAGCVVTLPGSGMVGYSSVAVDAAGDVYAVSLGSTVTEIPAGCATTACITTVASGFTSAQVVALDGAGNLYVADGSNNSVTKLDRVDPPSVTFATGTPAGSTDTTDGAQTVTLANIGTQTLTFTPPPANGQNPSISSNFSLTGTSSTGACPVLNSNSTGSLASAAACTAMVEFTPATGGSSGMASGQLIFTDNNPGAGGGLGVTGGTQTVSLSGTIANPPVVTSISPTAGPTAGGTIVTLTGTDFTGATAVAFGATAATSFNVNGGTSITATSPAGSAGTVDITVTTPNGTSATSAADQFTYDAPPTVSGISPNAGPTAGGTSVTLTGTNFVAGNTSVTIGSSAIAAGSVTVTSATSLTFMTPANAAGPVNVTVTTPGGTSSAVNYTYAAPPTLTGISPGMGVMAGGTPVTLTGTNFFAGDTTVTIGTATVPASSVTVNSATSLTFTTPAAPMGTVSVSATTPGGTTSTGNYTYQGTPVIAVQNMTAPVTSIVTLGATVTFAPGTTPTGAFSFTVGTDPTAVAATCTAATATTETCTASYSFGNLTANTYTITGSIVGDMNYIATSNTGTLTVTPLPAFLVTTLTDDATGVAANCVANATDASGGNGNCSLRDALAAANALTLAPTSPGAAVNFLGSLASVAVPAAINLTTGGTLVVSQSVTLNGLGANALRLSGGSSIQIISITAGTATISGLSLHHGSSGGTNGGAILFNGTALGVSNSVFSSNTTNGSGGAIYAGSGAGTLTVTNTTFASNSGSTSGGAIYSTGSGVSINNATFATNQTSATGNGGAILLNAGTNTIRNSTFSGNTAGIGGAVQSNAATTITNSIFAANTATVAAAAIQGSSVSSQNNVFYQDTVSGGESDCAACTTNSNAVSGNPNLSALGNYGGTVMTMVPVAPSAAICAGTVALSSNPGAASNQMITDERGATHGSGYCSATQLDAGAVQTSYAISITQNPASIVPSNTTFSPAPSATVTENGAGISGASVAISAANGTLTGTTPVSTDTNGLATFSDLQITGAHQGDTLTASLGLYTGVTGSPLTATSTSFSSLVITPTTLTAGKVGVAYSQQLATNNGNVPYTYTVAAGPSLPAGLTLSPSGLISGTPTAGGTFTFNVTATDTNGANITQNIGVTMAPPTITVGPSTLPTLYVGVAPTITFSASGGTAPYSYAVTAGSLPAGLQLNMSTGQVTGSPLHAVAYSFAVTATDSSTGTGPYSATSMTYTGTTQKGTALVTLGGLSQLYTGSPVSASASTVPNGLTVNFLYGPVNTTPTSSTPPTNPGQYAVTATVSDADYVGTASGILVIAKSTGSVILSNLNQTYTGSPISATATTTSPSGLAVNITYNGSSVPPTAAGSYAVVASIADPSYAGSASGTLIINKATLTIQAPTLSAVYGAALPALTGTYTGNLGGDTFTVGGNVAATGTLPVGPYTITPTVNGSALANYNVVPVTGTLTITPATLTIKGPNVSVMYGATSLPPLTGSYTGSVNGDTFNVAGSTTATTTSNVVAGGYAITPSVTGTNIGNYTVVTVPGVLTITPATLTITGPTLSKVYGAGVPSPLVGSYTGNVHGDSFTVTGATTATVLSPVVAGGYPITPSVTGPNLGNYNVVQVAGTLNVTPATLTITGPSVSAAYGAALPSLNGTYSQPVGTDTFTVTGSVAVTGSALVAGMYPITPSVTGTNLSSYTVVPVPGTLTITKATLTITAPTLSRVYGQANPAFTGTYSGNVNGDTFTVSGTTAATTNTPVSTTGYAVVPTVTGANIGSYSVVAVNGSLTITPATLTVTVAAATKTYGTPNPTLTGTVTGVLSGDGIVPVYSTTATTSSTVGTYPITAALSDPNSRISNYTVVNTPNTLTITKATPTVGLSNSGSPVFSQTAVTLTASVTSAVGTPTGIVTFMDGATTLGTVLLSNTGGASLTVSTLPDGSQPITAVYAGDSNYVTLTSSPSTVLVQDFAFTLPSGGVPGQSAPLGGTATFNFTLTPQDGATFPAAISLSLNGLPIGASYTFTPSSIAAGSGATAVKLTVTLPQQLANNGPSPFKLGKELAPITLALLMLPIFASKRRRSVKKLLCIALLMVAGSAATFGIMGCGSSSPATGTTPQPTSFNLTITAASGNLSRSTITTLTLQ